MVKGDSIVIKDVRIAILNYSKRMGELRRTHRRFMIFMLHCRFMHFLMRK